MIKRVQARVFGRVQGVGYRYFATHVAEGLSLVGTVRNTADGGIEAVAEGEEAALHDFLVALHRGPHSAEVTEVATAWGDPVGGYSAFSAVA
jgi:acylphosphatase